MSDEDEAASMARADTLREAVKTYYEAEYPGYVAADFAIVVSGQTVEGMIGDGDEIDSAWTWVVGRGQLVHRTSGLLSQMLRALHRDHDGDDE